MKRRGVLGSVLLVVVATGVLAAGRAGGVVAGGKVDPANPLSIPKYVDPLPIPAVARPAGTYNGAPYYEVEMTQFTQKLHRDIPATTLWGYAGSYPGPTIEVSSGDKVYVRWISHLPTTHLLPVDTTIHGASAGAPEVRNVVHLHGGHLAPESDGHPEAWFTPDSTATGPLYTGSLYEYPNDQEATALWYHDHALGITRLNVYAGLAGAYIIRDSVEARLNLPSGPYELPLIIQDKSFHSDGSLFYPAEGDEPVSGVYPSVVPEFFGDTILVNGKVWPYMEVEPRKYRFRMLNASNARFYRMRLSSGQPFIQIGTDGGLMETPVAMTELILGPAERADIIVDFSGYAGQRILLTNDAATPYPGGDPVDPKTTGQIMQFRVAGQVSAPDTSSVPGFLRQFGSYDPASAAHTRDLRLMEGMDEYGRLLPNLDGKVFMDPVTEQPLLGSREIWRLINVSEDAHPIHLHLVQFQILDRQPFDVAHYEATGEIVFTGPARPPLPNEQGWKDTVRAYPGEITRIIAQYDTFPGLFVWHCHILEHEDHDMMRPLGVVAP